VLFEDLAELMGQRNAIDARIVDIVAEVDRDGLLGLMTGVKTVAHMVTWKLGVSPRNAETIVAIAKRLQEFPQCAAALRQGQLSLDQVGVIAERAGSGSDAHYVDYALNATVAQLRTAVSAEPRPEPEPDPADADDDADDDGDADADAAGVPVPRPRPEPERSISKTTDEKYTYWRIKLPHEEAAKVDAALASHRDALIAEWTRDHGVGEDTNGIGSLPVQVPPFPATIDAFMRLVDTSWDNEAACRPHGARTTVIVHLDLAQRVASLHLGPLLSDDDRRYLLCDSTCEVWFERNGQPVGAGRTTRTISRRLRRALEHRDRHCRVPGCAATRGLHAHHIVHWEDGGETELDNLILVCPHHHRAHHRGEITIAGPADRLVVTDEDGDPLDPGSLARPPTIPPPAVRPYRGPTGERAQWKWYHPYQPPPPTCN